MLRTDAAVLRGSSRSSPWGIPRGDNLPYVITNPTADILCQV